MIGFTKSQMEFTIQPKDELMADASAGIFIKEEFNWRTVRDFRQYHSYRSASIPTLQYFRKEGCSWKKDSHDYLPIQDVIPWDGNGHIYDNDGPHTKMRGGTGANYEYEHHKIMNFRSYVKIAFRQSKKIPSKDWLECSEYLYWHSFQHYKRNAANKPWYRLGDNEVATGLKFWGSAVGIVNIEGGDAVIALPTGTVGAAYTAYEVKTTTPLNNISWSLSDRVPPGFTIVSTGNGKAEIRVVDPSKMKPGDYLFLVQAKVGFHCDLRMVKIHINKSTIN